ncbi:MAG: carboxypeptidase-like regulatory domain-containing protein [Cellulomonas sp.]|uniref:carboxypeptidase-like regulatory domain-containing protein n=1 Tax=Cellulomonas sp. TaxID=40001 RepID=UPI00258D16D6|nr:carboxypeptidase-like regulatory domain-containing protein [Cellulomonas sp.]MCR6704531.1 carboxypeptidase-like regulatory domain-containing protein [Cellulomonas sp.]
MRRRSRLALALTTALVAAGLAVPAAAATTVTTSFTGTAVLQGTGAHASRVEVLVASSTAHLAPDTMVVSSEWVNSDGTFYVDAETAPGAKVYLRVHSGTSEHVDELVVGADGATALSYLQLAPIVADGGTVTLPTTRVPGYATVRYTASRAVACARLLRLDGSLVSEECSSYGTTSTTFTFTQVVPGRYKVQPRWWTGATNAAGSAVSLTAAPGTTTRVSSTVSTPAVLAGTVTNASGKAVPGVAVYAVRGDSVTSTMTSTKGRYEFRGLKAGTYEVEYSGASGSSTTAAKYRTTSTTAKVSSGTTRTVNRTLAVGASIKATVAHAGTGLISVTAVDASGKTVGQTSSYRTGAGEEKVTLQGLPKGTYTLAVVDEGRHRYVTKTVKAKTGAWVSAGTLKPAKRTVTLTGTVAGATSGSVMALGPGSRIQVDDSDISTTGRYELTNLVPGTYDVDVVVFGSRGRYGYRTPRTVTVPATKTLALPRPVLVIESPTRVSATVTYQGLPIERVELSDTTNRGALVSESSNAQGKLNVYWERTPVTVSATGGWDSLLGGHLSPLYLKVVSPTSVSSAADLKTISLSGVGGA